MATLRYPGRWTYLPRATGQIIEYIRKPKDFPINRYSQFVPTPASSFVYHYIDPDQPVRMVSDAEWAWGPGDARPTGNANQLSFYMVPGKTNRRSYPYTLDEETVQQNKEFNDIDFTVQNAGSVACQAMVNRTNRVITMLQTASNWGANTADANTINGGYGNFRNASADPSSPNFLAIKRAIGNACKVIRLSTNGMVKRRDLRLVLSLGLAEIMADTDEIYNYVKFGPYSQKAQRGDDRDMDEDGGLPPKLYGVEVCIEDSTLVNVYPNASGTAASIASGQRVFIKNDTTAILTSRVGGVEGSYGAPSFTTTQVYFFGPPMQVEEFPDPKNRRVEGFVTEDYQEVLAAPASGFFITSCS